MCLRATISCTKYCLLRLFKANPGVVGWLCQGKVGQPEYDSLTNKMKSNAKATSDVTREVRNYFISAAKLS